MSTQKKKGVKYTEKRKFHGNQHSPGHSKAKKVCVDQSVTSELHDSVIECVQDDMQLSGEPSCIAKNTPTTSEKKLLFMYSVMNEEDSVTEEKQNMNGDSDNDDDVIVSVDSTPVGNRIIDMTILSDNITSQLVCRFCHGTVSLFEVKRQGLDSEIAFHCSNNRCNGQLPFHTSAKISIGNMSVCSVNRLSVLAMRTIGGDRAELSMFCGVMDLPPPVCKSSFNIINKNKEKAACSVQPQLMTAAARLEHSQATPQVDDHIRDIDGSSGKLTL